MAGSDGKPRGMKEYVDVLERRVAVLEERCVPAHPGGIGESAQRFHGGLVEQRQNPFRVPLPAEPPGSPTVEEDDYEPYEALVSENDALRALSAHKEKAIELLQAQVVSLQKRNAWLSDDVNAEIKKRVAAETADREYREKIADWLAEMTND